MSSNFLRSLTSRRTYVLAALHLVICSWIYWAAFRLQPDVALTGQMPSVFWTTVTWVVAVKLAAFFVFGSFQASWRYVSFADLAALLAAASSSSLLIAVLDRLTGGAEFIPLQILLVDWGLTILVLGALRSGRRLIGHVWSHLVNNGKSRSLMVGTTENSAAAVRHIETQAGFGYRFVGLVDDNSTLQGARIAGLPVLGPIAQIAALAAKHHATTVFAIANSLDGRSLRTLVKDCRDVDVKVKIIPSVDQLRQATSKLSVREVDINDLLRRDPIHLDCGAISSLLHGRRIMVTGAGGSIGSEICRQIVRFGVSALILAERTENNLFHIDQGLRGLDLTATLIPCIADICDTHRMRALFERYRPEILFHAAAHKHVPMMESNCGEAIKNNVLGTKKVADLAAEFQVERFVLLSTDKAVNPTSVMGVTKQLAEQYIRYLSEQSDTRFIIVRFGNVLASAGSVVPIFQEQIRRGGPVTITHPEMRRFFMTIPEASQLVLQASAMGEGGEIFVLDMGEPVRILDLAKDLIRLSGIEEGEIQTVFIGPRPGEKLFEELCTDDDQTACTEHPKLRVVRQHSETVADIRDRIDELSSLIDDTDDEIRHMLGTFVPKYSMPPVASIAVRAVCAAVPTNGNGDGNGSDNGDDNGNGNGHKHENGNGKGARRRGPGPGGNGNGVQSRRSQGTNGSSANGNEGGNGNGKSVEHRSEAELEDCQQQQPPT